MGVREGGEGRERQGGLMAGMAEGDLNGDWRERELMKLEGWANGEIEKGAGFVACDFRGGRELLCV